MQTSSKSLPIRGGHPECRGLQDQGYEQEEGSDMKHIQPRTLQQPLEAQSNIGALGKAIIDAILFGINPLFTLLVKGESGQSN